MKIPKRRVPVRQPSQKAEGEEFCHFLTQLQSMCRVLLRNIQAPQFCDGTAHLMKDASCEAADHMFPTCLT